MPSCKDVVNILKSGAKLWWIHFSYDYKQRIFYKKKKYTRHSNCCMYMNGRTDTLAMKHKGASEVQVKCTSELHKKDPKWQRQGVKNGRWLSGDVTDLQSKLFALQGVPVGPAWWDSEEIIKGALGKGKHDMKCNKYLLPVGLSNGSAWARCFMIANNASHRL
jgi:hypothetical protein